VGAGLAGLVVASKCAHSSTDCCVLEKSSSAGGTWRHHGNALSRVNSSEPSYRLVTGSCRRNTNHSYRSEILTDALSLVKKYDLARLIRTGHSVAVVTKVVVREGVDCDQTLVKGTDKGKSTFTLRASIVVLCTNRRLGVPRRLKYDGEEAYGGLLCRGLSGDTNDIGCAGHNVAILGMGAFAVESMRTCFEQGAARCTILCRRRGSVCPQIVDWINFVRPFDDDFKRDTPGDTIVFTHWQRCYSDSTATQPECWKEGLIKPDGHTVSTSDLYFIAHRQNMMAVKLGEVGRLDANGIVTRSEQVVEAFAIIKCVGFELNEGNEALLGRSRMTCAGRAATGVWLQIEAHLDSRFFNNPFGSSYLNFVSFNAELLVRHWKDSLFGPSLQLPSVRINSVTASEMLHGLELLSNHDSSVKEMLRRHLEAVTFSFHDTLSPSAYVTENIRLWERCHAMLRPRKEINHIPSWKYPFSRLWSALSDTPDTHPAQSDHVFNKVGIEPRDVLAIAQQVLSDGVLDIDASFHDAGLDSISATEFRSKLDSFGVSLPASLIFEAPSARLVSAKLTGSDAAGAQVSLARVPAHEVTIISHAKDTCSIISLRDSGSAYDTVVTVILPSTWGNVEHYQRLASAMEGPVWGVEHAFLRSGDPSCLRVATIEEFAACVADVISNACTIQALQQFHALGGSYGALLAQKVMVAASRSSTASRRLVMIDPPPPGPCTKGYVQPGILLATQIVRLGREIAGVDTHEDTLRVALHMSVEQWSAALEISETNDTSFVPNADEDWALAIAATEHLASLGQLKTDTASILRTKRRMDVYRACMRLWRAQEILCNPPEVPPTIMLVQSSLRSEWFGYVYDDYSPTMERWELYGHVSISEMIDGKHTSVVQDICTNRNPRVTSTIKRFLGSSL